MKAIASISFWDPGMTASMVKDKLPQTMPLFWKDEMAGYPRYKLKPLLKDFLQKVKDIAKGKIANDLTNVAIVSSHTYYENLAMFINLGNENIENLYSDIEKREIEHTKCRETIWSSFGQSIMDRDRYKFNGSKASANDSDEDDSESDSDDSESDSDDSDAL